MDWNSANIWWVAAGLMVAAELATGSFYLLMVAFGMVAGALAAHLGLAGSLPAPPPHPDKTIVEHTAINPNKAAHIGHLRNSALGDTLVRALRFRGNPVEVQNYIDDTGVQVADVVVGFQHLESIDLAGAKRIAASIYRPGSSSRGAWT